MAGRWAYMTSEANIRYPTLTTGYGYLRAPWNMNPSPYLTRFATENSFPSCSSYYNWLKKSSLMMFLKYAPGPPHARWEILIIFFHPRTPLEARCHL